MRVLSRALARVAGRSGSSPRELVVAVLVAWCLVIARSAVYIVYEHSYFDSDQAIPGLMAKHLVEGRAFPLFLYGQTYMLAIDAWVAAPFIWAAGPTVAALRSSLVFTNLVTITLLIVSLSRWCGLRPMLGLAAGVFYAFAPPLTSAFLVEAGANAPPLLWIVLLWMIRDRPLWFGAVFAIGFLNREFTAYAIPILLLVQAWERTLWRPETIRNWLIAAAVGAALWQGIDALKPYSDMMGPGTRGQLIHGYGGSQFGNMAERAEIIVSDLPKRTLAMLTVHLPRMYGARFVRDPSASQGRDWIYWPLVAGLVLALGRGAWLVIRGQQARADGDAPSAVPPPGGRTTFAWYLIGVGLTAASAYIATRDATGTVDRYLLLTLFFPIGIGALFLTMEPLAWPRRAFIALLLVWAGCSAVDHVRLASRYWGGREPNEVRVIADALVARGRSVAISTYWRAYKITYIAQERVKVAATDFVRIDEYQRLADAEGDRLIEIRETPCAEGEHISVWFLCRFQPVR
jgi:hypothetical protein